MTRAMTAVLGGLKDVIFGRLTWLAIINLVIAATITFFAARAGLQYIVPLVPTGPKRRLGILEGLYTVPDDFDDPLPDDVIDEFYKPLSDER